MNKNMWIIGGVLLWLFVFDGMSMVRGIMGGGGHMPSFGGSSRGGGNSYSHNDDRQFGPRWSSMDGPNQ